MNKTGKLIYFIITAVVILIVGLAVFISADRSEKETQKNFEYACKLMDNDNYETAVSYFDKVLDKKTDYTDAYLFKAQSLEALGRTDDAVAVAEFGYKKTKSQELLDFKATLISDSEILTANQYVVSANDDENDVISGKFENIDGNGSQVTDIYDYSAALNQQVSIPDITTVVTKSNEISSENDVTLQETEIIFSDISSEILPDVTEPPVPSDTVISETVADMTSVSQSDITDITETTAFVNDGYTDEEVQQKLSETVEYLMKFLEKYWAY